MIQNHRSLKCFGLLRISNMYSLHRTLSPSSLVDRLIFQSPTQFHYSDFGCFTNIHQIWIWTLQAGAGTLQLVFLRSCLKHTHTEKKMTEHSCGILTLWHKRNFLRFEGHREKGEMLFGLTTTTPWFNVKWATKLKDTGEKEDSTHSHFNCKVIKLLIQYTSSLN